MQIPKTVTSIMHIPTVIGSVVLTYNIPGVDKNINFTSEAIAGIYLEQYKMERSGHSERKS